MDDFLAELDVRTKKLSGTERALYHALMYFREEIGDLLFQNYQYFMKAFRQCDITNSGNGDMIIYELLDASKIFWDLVAEVFVKDIKDES